MIQDRIRQLVASFGLTTNSFAAKIGSAQTNIHNIVSGRGSAPRWETYEKILEAFPEVSAEWLSRGTPPMFLDAEKQKAYEDKQTITPTANGQQGNGEVSVNKVRRINGVTNDIAFELTQARTALGKCQEDRTELERELRKSKDKIIELLEKR